MTAASLHRLVYYSRTRLPGDPALVKQAVDEILAASRRNNARVDVTGALMFNGGCFAQVLEGPLTAVETTFERIQQDDRHGDVSLLAMTPISDRGFSTWSMAYVGASAADADRFGYVAVESGFDLSLMSGERLHEVLVSLVLDEEQLAA